MIYEQVADLVGRLQFESDTEIEGWSDKNFWDKLVTAQATRLIIAWLIFEMFFEAIQPTKQPLTPNEGIHRSLKKGVIGGLFFALVLGLLFGLLFGLIYALVAGLSFGLVAGLRKALQHYLVRFWLAHSGIFPWKAVPFLEDATTRILLQRVGGGYRFVHRLLLDYFADAYGGASSAQPSATPSTTLLVSVIQWKHEQDPSAQSLTRTIT